MIIKERLYRLKRNSINYFRHKFSIDYEQTCILPDKLYIKLKYKKRMNKKLNLRNPKTYNEKLQWLKLYNRHPEYSNMVDKYEAKKYVADIIGEEYIIPTLGVWDKFEDVNFDTLPEQFVLKCTHTSGGVIVCKNKKELDIEKTKSIINNYLNIDYFLHTREWPYKGMKRRIIAEKYILDYKNNELKDYKFYCFDGEVKALLIASERSSGKTRYDYFDPEFNRLHFEWGGPPSDKVIEKPINFEKMKKIAEKLSQGICTIRVDLYEAEGKIYFGELTFFDGSGMTSFEPDSWDETFGKWIKLPKKKRR